MLLLRDKFEKLEAREKLEKEAKDRFVAEKTKAITVETLITTNLSGFQGDFISSWQLEAMIKQQSTSFIIFDVRSKEDFKISHIKHPNCVSIPEDTLKPGLVNVALIFFK